jgi:hypothetical protein
MQGMPPRSGRSELEPGGCYAPLPYLTRAIIRRPRPTPLSPYSQPERLRQERSVGRGLAEPMPSAARNESVSAWNIMPLVKACVATP